MLPRARLLPLLIVVALALLAPGASTALAAGDLEVGIADDAALLHETSDARAAATVQAWADLGIDNVRIFAAWQAISPGNASKTMPAGFDPANPDAAGYDWAKLDRAVNLVRAQDMTVTLVVSGPGPLWASMTPSRNQVRYKPRPDLFGKFASAVAKRYRGAVDRYVIWNEPNLPLWLQPQFTCQGRRCTPYAPHLYRKLVRAAYPAIKAADTTSTVLFGALAPRGDSPTGRNVRTRPLAFIRAMGCVNTKLKRTRSGSCKGFQPLTADGFSYHPHNTIYAPDHRYVERDEAGIGDLTRLKTTLDRTQSANGFRKPGGGRFNLYFSEWGYQTNPPDKIGGVSLAKQSRWLQQGAYIAWHDPRVKLLTQYAWRDEPLGRGNIGTRYSGWQSGLRFADDRAKPSLRTFANPFVADVRRASKTVRLWGQVRPGEVHEITLQRRRPGLKTWVTVGKATTNGDGYWTTVRKVNSALDYRYTWQPRDGYGSPLGAVRSSDAVRVKLPRR